jgi:hypothetical protein
VSTGWVAHAFGGPLRIAQIPVGDDRFLQARGRANTAFVFNLAKAGTTPRSIRASFGTLEQMVRSPRSAPQEHCVFLDERLNWGSVVRVSIAFLNFKSFE